MNSKLTGRARPFFRRIGACAACLLLCLALSGCMGVETALPHLPPDHIPELPSAAPSPAAATPEAASSPTPEPTPLPVTPEPLPAPEPPEEIVISLIGDCTLGGDPRIGQLDSFRGVYRQNGEDPAYFFSGALPYIGQDSLTIVNLEGPLTALETGAEKEFAFRGDPGFAAILPGGGVEAVSLANNHSLDYGEQGYADTLAALDAQGVLAADAGRPVVYRAGAWSIGVAAAKFPTRERLAQLAADIESLREQGCVIVVAVMHWGDERAEAPDPAVQSAAHSAVDAGADLVVGHHPHILQGIERYNGRIIAYSVGNFVFGGNRNPAERETAIFQQRFLFDGEGVVPDGFRVLPYAVSGSPGNDYRPVELTGDAAQKVYDAINRRGSLLPSWATVTEGWNAQE